MSRLACLVACVALLSSGCSSSAPSPQPSPSPVATVATDSLVPPTPTPTPTPTPRPTPRTSGLAWTTRAVTVYPQASDDVAAQVHLGGAFPVYLTSRTAAVEGAIWDEISWGTPSRSATGWLPASAVSLDRPAGIATAGFDALDPTLADYLTDLGARIGVVAYDVTRGVTYTYNATHTYFAASSMKVPIMLTLLSQCEAKGREPTGREVWLLQTMIENSNNNSAEELYEDIGAQKGIDAFMARVGIAGLTPGKPGWWGHSTISPTTMVALLTRLQDGTVLNDAHRKLALGYMEHIDSAGLVGIGDSSPAGATIAMKDGWTTALDGTGTWVVNTSGIVTLGGETYILSVYTAGDPALSTGWKIVRHVAKVVGEKLMPEA